jgi:hypothetical protein
LYSGPAVKDVLILASLVLAFATLVTVHVLLAALLTRTRPRWRGLVALMVPPLAPIWGYREGRRRTATLWVMAAVAYTIALIAAKTT